MDYEKMEAMSPEELQAHLSQLSKEQQLTIALHYAAKMKRWIDDVPERFYNHVEAQLERDEKSRVAANELISRASAR